MPRAAKQPTLARQWELMRLIPSRFPGRTVKELCETLAAVGYTVTKRTVERDLTDLAGIFPLQCNAISKPYGWHWEPGAQLEIPGMDLSEALSLGLLEDVLRPLVPSSFVRGLEGRFEIARQKLASLKGNERAQWRERVRYLPPGQTFIPPTVLPSILHEVQKSLLHSRILRAGYRAAGADTEKELELHPLAMLQQGVRTYLIATAFNYDEPLLYALHRFVSAEVMDEPAKRPDGFSLDRLLERGGGQFGGGKVITLKASITENLARLLEETPLSRDQKITKGKDGFRLATPVFDSWQLHFWILSQGAEIVVRQPAALRKEIVERIEGIWNAYHGSE